LRITVIVAVVNSLIAAGLTLSDEAPGSFWPVLFYSQCIGMSIFLLHALLGRVVLPGNKSVQMFERIFIAAPVGYSVGTRIAATLRGDPISGVLFFGAPFSQIMITVVASLCVVYYHWSSARIYEEVAAHARAEQFASEAVLKMLRTQLEPHMLFNTLANLRVLVEVDTTRAQSMIDELIVYLRGTLYASGADLHSLSDEYDQLRAYLNLMKIRMADRLDFELVLPVELESFVFPTMLLQPIVENAIKHGLEPTVLGGQIMLRASADVTHVQVEIDDTGLGINTGSSPGYGLTHIKERLEVLYQHSATFTIEAGHGGGTHCVLRIPKSANTRANNSSSNLSYLEKIPYDPE
jgi:signal transduction histidine kinase